VDEKISERVREVIESKTRDRRRTQELEETTGISGETWRKFLSGKQKVSLVMLQAVAHLWPEYAFWISTGITDSAHGHIGPDVAYENPVNRKLLERVFAGAYFRIKLDEMDGRETEIELEKLLPKPHEGYYSTLSEGDNWRYESERVEYEKASKNGKMRMELERLRFSTEAMKRAVEMDMRYEKLA